MISTQLLSVHPVLPVRDMSKTLTFYEEKLGFRRVFDDASTEGAPINYAGVARSGVCLHLQTLHPSQAEPTQPQLRIKVADIDPLYREYADKGLVLKGGHLEEKPWGSRDFGIYDCNMAALVFFEDLKKT